MSHANAIACPACGAATSVTETRIVKNGLRRRRRCLTTACGGRLTTIEMVVPSGRRLGATTLALVPLADIEAIHVLVGAILEARSPLGDPLTANVERRNDEQAETGGAP